MSLEGLQENPRNSRSIASPIITRFLFSEAVYSFRNDVLHTLMSDIIIALTVNKGKEVIDPLYTITMRTNRPTAFRRCEIATVVLIPIF